MITSDGQHLFDVEELPSERLRDLPERLVGFQRRYQGLRRDLQILADIEGLEAWSMKHYQTVLPLVRRAKDRYPLVIFHGDVGTGKTETAEGVADRLTRELETEAMLFKLSTRVRGTGAVGQMSTLINQTFQIVMEGAGKMRHAFLIIDEADSLAGDRGLGQSQHEDKVAVNTLIQKIDDIRRFDGRIMVILCTNRFGALDPAIVRRAGRIEIFQRPTAIERRELLEMDCAGLGVSEAAMTELVRLTGPEAVKGRPGFTFSDLRTRLLPESLARAYPEEALTEKHLLEAAAVIRPSPVIAQ